MYVGATQFDRFNSLLGSIGIRFTCRRVPPCRAFGPFRAMPETVRTRPSVSESAEVAVQRTLTLR
eukprot:3712074-Alexandrium_andersonii.AAC.1